MRLAKGNDPRAVRCAIGARDGHVVLRIGDLEMQLTPEQAEEMSVDLRTYAIEVRNGGQLT